MNFTTFCVKCKGNTHLYTAIHTHMLMCTMALQMKSFLYRHKMLVSCPDNKIPDLDIAAEVGKGIMLSYWSFAEYIILQ